MKANLHSLFTIGYQGKSIDSLIAELVAANIEVLFDVRRKPISRKPGFSKHSLSLSLQRHGIEYCHVPDLGMPADLLQYKNNSDNSPILHEYKRLLPGQQSRIDDVSDTARERRSCLLCFEADHEQCHRGILANEMESTKQFLVKHL